MPTSFPGIDPFIEGQSMWPDFHARTITYSADLLAELLPEPYQVRIEERVQLVDQASETLRRFRPDLLIERTAGLSTVQGALVVLEVEPLTISVSIEEFRRETYIEIIHRPDKSLVTVIELLSPDNKLGVGRTQYLAKRNAILHGPVHLIELDFLVGGQRLPMVGPLPPGDAFAIVARGDRRPDSEVYAWSIRRPLSAIRVPLLAPDPDLTLDLGVLYATAFAKGRYDRSIDYQAALTVPLSTEDRVWAEELARAPR